MSVTGEVHNPSYYQSLSEKDIDAFDCMEASFGKGTVKDFCLCNALKYIFRCRRKENEIQDVKKAKEYLDKYLALCGE